VRLAHRVLDRRAHWRHLANTVGRLCAAAISGSAVRSVDSACSQIILDNLVVLLLSVSSCIVPATITIICAKNTHMFDCVAILLFVYTSFNYYLALNRSISELF